MTDFNANADSATGHAQTMRAMALQTAATICAPLGNTAKENLQKSISDYVEYNLSPTPCLVINLARVLESYIATGNLPD
jgi:uncharacterized protein YfdQ (DUF2303 family)